TGHAVALYVSDRISKHECGHGTAIRPGRTCATIMEPQSLNLDTRPEARLVRAARLESARRELMGATERGEGGRAALRQFSHRMDAMVQQLFADAGQPSQSVGIFALGGYGRRQLCLYSDIDLLVIFGGPIGPADERFLHAFLNPLWDLGLTVGHHVREVQEGS